MKKVLVVVAHADDEILGPGGALARHIASGDDARVAIAADCRAARADVQPGLLPAAVLAAEKLGLLRDPVFLGFRAMQLQSCALDLNKMVSQTVEAFRPDIVYTHHWSDLNSDHRAVCEAVMVAMRPTGSQHQIVCFETPSSTEWAPPSPGFVPNYFVDITVTIEKKLEAMAAYEDELRPPPHPRGLAALRTRAAYWGQVAGVKYAEAFALAREVV